jgi:hypothetical protein
MKQGLIEKNWQLLYASVHKMIPSFSIVGINKDFENMAKKLQEFASSQKYVDEIHDLAAQLESICNQACIELNEEILNIKKNNK